MTCTWRLLELHPTFLSKVYQHLRVVYRSNYINENVSYLSFEQDFRLSAWAWQLLNRSGISLGLDYSLHNLPKPPTYLMAKVVRCSLRPMIERYITHRNCHPCGHVSQNVLTQFPLCSLHFCLLWNLTWEVLNSVCRKKTPDNGEFFLQSDMCYLVMARTERSWEVGHILKWNGHTEQRQAERGWEVGREELGW